MSTCHDAMAREFFDSLEDRLVGPAHIVLMGDFNCVLHPEDHRALRGTPRSLGRDYRGTQALGNLVDELDLRDSWRALQPGRDGMTWASRGLESRTDQVYVSTLGRSPVRMGISNRSQRP